MYFRQYKDNSGSITVFAKSKIIAQLANTEAISSFFRVLFTIFPNIIDQTSFRMEGTVVVFGLKIFPPDTPWTLVCRPRSVFVHSCSRPPQRKRNGVGGQSS